MRSHTIMNRLFLLLFPFSTHTREEDSWDCVVVDDVGTDVFFAAAVYVFLTVQSLSWSGWVILSLDPSWDPLLLLPCSGNVQSLPVCCFDLHCCMSCHRTNWKLMIEQSWPWSSWSSNVFLINQTTWVTIHWNESFRGGALDHRRDHIRHPVAHSNQLWHQTPPLLHLAQAPKHTNIPWTSKHMPEVKGLQIHNDRAKFQCFFMRLYCFGMRSKWYVFADLGSRSEVPFSFIIFERRQTSFKLISLKLSNPHQSYLQ